MVEKKPEKCSIEDCAIKDHVDFIVSQFKEIAHKLTQNHIELRMSVVKLTENMKYVQRVHERIDDLEKKFIEENKELKKKVEESDKELQKKIEKNNMTLYKVVGGVSVLYLVIPWVIKLLMKL